MYETYYHFRAKPFQLSPDPSFLYSSRGHRRAMSYLLYGMHQGEGFVVITGEIGAGKTMLASTLVRNMTSKTVVLAQITNTNLEADDFIRMVAAAFGLSPETNKAGLLKRIEDFLLACHVEGKRAILVVDEAQNIPSRSLEELRMLSNFVYEGKPLVQTFLLGQPEFRKTLQRPDMEQLSQRVIASCHLGPLDCKETEDYILHRLRTVGWQGDPSFTADAFAAIYQHARGVPRKINLVCDRLLLLGQLEEKHGFTAQEVSEVVDELQQEHAPVALRVNQ
jgi:putative secretion ATPase (PEP-CTERM system associated)